MSEFGTMMGVALRPVGHKFRGVVACVEVTEDFDPAGDVQILWEGEPKPTPKSAHLDAMKRYWGLYQFKNGFKHPDDPSRTPEDPPPSKNVLVSYGEDA